MPDKMKLEQALRLAKYINDNRAEFDRERRFQSIADLAEYGVFSSRQISKLTGVRIPDVLPIVNKTDRTGGKFDAAAIPFLLEIIENRRAGIKDPTPYMNALEAGCSTSMISRLTGISLSTVQRRVGINI